MANIHYILAVYKLKELIVRKRRFLLVQLYFHTLMSVRKWLWMEHFHLLPKIRVYQVVVVTIFFQGHVSVQLQHDFLVKCLHFFWYQALVLATALCSGKTEALYKMILEHIKTKAAEIPGARPMVPKKMHSDFEKAIMNALQEVITGIVIGCYYHYCQVIMSKKIILLQMNFLLLTILYLEPP